jgi:hypothetical protein
VEEKKDQIPLARHVTHAPRDLFGIIRGAKSVENGHGVRGWRMDFGGMIIDVKHSFLSVLFSRYGWCCCGQCGGMGEIGFSAAVTTNQGCKDC